MSSHCSTPLDTIRRAVYIRDMASLTSTRRDLREAGEFIRISRRNLGLSPEQLGYEIGVSGRTIRRIEDGHRPVVRTAFLLASYFDAEVSELWPM